MVHENHSLMESLLCPPCNNDRFGIYCSLFFACSHLPLILILKKPINCNTSKPSHFIVCIHVYTSVLANMSAFAYSLFISLPELGVFLLLWPLKVHGWHAITKTPLSITLTDRLKKDSIATLPHEHSITRPLSFNVPPLSLYRQLLSITWWLGKMACVTLEERLLCSLLSFG